jgi:hypothetical protein
VVGTMEMEKDGTTSIQTLAELWLAEQIGIMEEMRRKKCVQTCGLEANETFYGRLWLRLAKKILNGVL